MRSIRFGSLFAFVLLMVSSLSADAYGQRKVISFKEYFDGAHGTTGSKWNERTRRIETLEEELTNGVVTKSDLEVYEFVSTDRDRHYRKTVEGGKTKEFEQITIEHFQYTRVDDGAWTKVDLRTLKGGVGVGSGSASGSPRATCTQFSVEPVVISGTPVKLFEMIELLNVGNELTFNERRNWTTDEGVPYRSERVKGLAFPRVETWREVITYDYSSDLKIEAPIP